MTSSRTVTIVVGAGLLAAWFAAANGSRPAAPPLRMPAAAADPQLREVQQLLRQTNRLDSAMAAMAAPRDPARNPFQFGSANRSRHESAARGTSGRFAGATAAPVPPPAPVFELEGMAGDTTGGLTAIVSGDGRLFLVKVGDLVTARYRVKAIAPGAVELEDLTGGPIVRLEMH